MQDGMHIRPYTKQPKVDCRSQTDFARGTFGYHSQIIEESEAGN